MEKSCDNLILHCRAVVMLQEQVRSGDLFVNTKTMQGAGKALFSVTGGDAKTFLVSPNFGSTGFCCSIPT